MTTAVAEARSTRATKSTKPTKRLRAAEAPALVRLKPYNPKRGITLRKYTHGPTDKKFEEVLGWYKVSQELAEYLATVRQRHHDPESQFAFDVTDEAGARAIMLAEKKAKERKDPEDANDLVTRDLRTRDEITPVDERRAERARRVPRSMR